MKVRSASWLETVLTAVLVAAFLLPPQLWSVGSLRVELRPGPAAIEVRLTNTSQTKDYEILSKTNLSAPTWNTERQVPGLDGGSITFLPTNRPPTVFYTAREVRAVTNLGLLLRLASTNLSYSLGTPPLALDRGATVENLAHPTFAGGQLTLSFSAGGDPDDRIAVSHLGNGPGKIGVNGSVVSWGGVSIGTTAGGVGLTPLQVLFNSNASAASLAALLRAITFENRSLRYSRQSRTIRYDLTDGQGARSVPAFLNVDVACPGAVDVVVVFDVSFSLPEPAFLRMKQAATNLIGYLNPAQDRVGLVTFYGSSVIVDPLTNDFARVRQDLLALSQKNGTVLHPGISNAQHLLLGNPSRDALRMMLILTDGEMNPYTEETNALLAASAAKAENIRIVGAGFVNDRGYIFNEFLSQIASSPEDYYAPNTTSNAPPLEVQLAAQLRAAARSFCRQPNNPPVAIAQATSTRVDTPVEITLSGSDPDGDALSYKVSSGPAHGTLIGTPPSLVYAPAPGYVGLDRFEFRADDGLVDSAPAAVSIEVKRSTQPCSLLDPKDWSIVASPPRPGPNNGPGTAVWNGCQIILSEGDSFRVEIARTFTAPVTPADLSFSYRQLSFDSTTTNAIRDAFEAAIVDEAGVPLTYVIGPGRDAAFNVSEGQEPTAPDGITYSTTSPEAGTVRISLAHLFPGQRFKLILRLINNDQDSRSSVRIAELRYESALEVGGSGELGPSPRAADPAPPRVLAGATPYAERATGRIDVSQLVDAGDSVQGEYGRTSFNEGTRVLYADLALRNVGTYPIRSPLYVGVTRISDPSVRMLTPDGVSSDGIPFYDFSATLYGDALLPGALSSGTAVARPPSLAISRNENNVVLTWSPSLAEGVIEQAPLLQARWNWSTVFTLNGVTNQLRIPISDGSRVFRLSIPQSTPPTRTIAFHNPNNVKFTYDLVVLGQLNRAPIISSVPILEAAPGKSYVYDAEASDPDGDPITFSLAQGPKFLRVNATNGVTTGSPTVADLGTHQVTVRVADGRGGSAEQRYTLVVNEPPPNRPPVFTSIPVAQASAATTLGPAAMLDLSKWTTFQYDLHSQGSARWILGDSNAAVTQVVNSDPALFLSPELVTNAIIQGTFQVRTNYDDDLVGFVFGYQDSEHYYVFDWAKGADGQEPYQRGMRVRAMHSATPLDFQSAHIFVGSDVYQRRGLALPVPQDEFDQRVTTLFTNRIAWADSTEYQFTLSYRPGHFTIVFRQGAATIETIAIADSAFGPGRFGFYNWSQEQVLYRGFTRQSVTGLGYAYDAQATDPDGDRLVYSLLDSPPGMAIDPLAGFIRWAPTVAQIGNHNVTVQVSDGRSGIATQSYVVTVLPDPANHPPVIVSQPVTNAIVGQSYTYDVDALDPDGDSITYSLTSNSAGMTINPTNGLIQWSRSSVALSSNLPFSPQFEVTSHATLPGPIGMALAPDGTLFVGRDQGEAPAADPHERIRQVNPHGLVSDFSAAIISDPDAVAFDVTGALSGVAGSVLVGGLSEGSDSLNYSSILHAVRPDGSVVEVLNFGRSYTNPNKFLIGQSGQLVFTANENGYDGDMTVYSYNGQAVSRITGGKGIKSRSFATDSRGQIYVVDWQDKKVIEDPLDDLWSVAVYSAGGILLRSNFVSNLGVARRITSPTSTNEYQSTTLLASSPATDCYPEFIYLLHNGELSRYTIDGQGQILASGFGGQASDMISGPDGSLYVSMNDGIGRILRLIPHPCGKVTVRADDGRGGFDTQSFVINIGPPPLPSVDLAIDNVDRSELMVDGQSLAAVGKVSATVTNVGPESIRQPFEVKFFEDLNHNEAYDPESDSLLGTSTVAGPLAPGQSTTVSAAVAASVSFPSTLVWAYADSGHAIAERNEGNNVAKNETHCQYFPTASGVPIEAPDLTACHLLVGPAGQVTTLTARIGNGGKVIVGPNIKVSFFNGNPSVGGGLVGVTVTTNRIVPGAFEEVSLLLTNPPPADLWVFADHDQDGIQQINECDESNNTYHPSDVAVGGIRGQVFNDRNSDGVWQADSDWLYCLAPDQLVRVTLDGTRSQYLLSGARIGGGIIFDPRTESMYANADGRIFRARYDGSQRTDLWFAASATFQIDASQNRLYWSAAYPWDNQPTGIYSDLLSRDVLGNTPTNPVITLDSPAVGQQSIPALAMDEAKRRLYFINTVTPSIDYLDVVSGLTSKFLILDREFLPIDLSLDVSTRRLYWNEIRAGQSDIWRVNLDDALPKFHVTGSTASRTMRGGIYADPGDQRVYFVDGDFVSRVDSDGSNYQRLVRLPCTSPRILRGDPAFGSELLLAGRTVFLDQNQNEKLDPFELSTTTDSYGRYAFTNLPPADYTVRLLQPQDWILTAPAKHSHQLRVAAGEMIGGVDFGTRVGHPEDYGTVSGTVYRDINLDGVRQDGDWLYWTTDFKDGQGHKFPSELRRVRLDGSCSETVLIGRSDDRFGGIAFDSERGHLFTGDNGRIIRANLDGTGATNILTDPEAIVDDLEIDLIHRRLYWSTAHQVSGPRGIVFSMNFDGSDKKTVSTRFEGLFLSGIALDPGNERLYVVASGAITSVPFDGGTLTTWTNGAAPFEIEFDPARRRVIWNDYADARQLNQGFGTVTFDGAPPHFGGFSTQTNAFANGFAYSQRQRKVYFGAIGGGVTSMNDDGTGEQFLTQSPKGFNYAEVLESSEVSVGEPALPGWIAFVDKNQNGRRDDFEPFSITDACGHYTFSRLEPGTYMIRLETPEGWRSSQPAREAIVLAARDTFGVDFPVNVLAEPVNHAPRFGSNPPTNAVLGRLYSYDSVVTDSDGDRIFFGITPSFTLEALKGAFFDSHSGSLKWIPKFVGPQPFTMYAGDGRGATAVQSFTVDVRPANHAPVITSQPEGPASVGRVWQYQVRVQDADADAIAFSLAQPPNGMTVNTTGGLITWTPTVADMGVQRVAINATDGTDTTTQFFDLPVVALSTNRPPQITAIPRGSIRGGDSFAFLVEASDPDSDPLTIRLTNAPPSMILTNAESFPAISPLVLWTSTQLGSNYYEVVVSDGRATVTYSYSLLVVRDFTNRPPQITTSPLLSAIAGSNYTYNASAYDPDNDFMRWDFTTHPAGMSIDPALGTIRWTPTLAQLGTNRVVVRVADMQGGLATQTFDIVVRPVNLPPQFSSIPITAAATNELYQYAVRVVDPEAGTLQFSLVTAPTNMAFALLNNDGSTGTTNAFATDGGYALIWWTPAGAQLGTNRVNIQVTDAAGASAVQEFNVVVTTNQNRAPIITSTPSAFASTNALYQYQLTAADADGDPLSFRLLDTPPAGMTINTNSGLVQWTPTHGGNFPVSLGAIDSKGAVGSQSFSISVTDSTNLPPVLPAIPDQRTVAGSLYRIDIRALDPNGDAITYGISDPAGMVIDALGRITWSPGAANIGTSSVTVTASDALGATASQSFQITVFGDNVPPTISIGCPQPPLDYPNGFPVNISTIDIVVTARDAVSGNNVRLLVTVGGEPVVLDSRGHGEALLKTVGVIPIVAIATDPSGNSSTSTCSVVVFDYTGDGQAPIVDFTAPAQGDVITRPIAIVGTAADTNLLFYTLSVRPVAGGEFREIARGSNSVVKATLGQFDPTILANDEYVLRLEARDRDGFRSVKETTVSVAGELKVGNFRLSFVDLSVPVNGIPVTVARGYDTLQVNERGDFGYGWRMEFRDAQLRTSLPRRTQDEIDNGIYQNFTDRTRVSVTLPGGKREVFTFKPAPAFSGSFQAALGFFAPYRPAFQPLRGATAELSVPSNLGAGRSIVLFRNLNGGWDTASDSGAGRLPYNADDPDMGGTYVVQTHDGLSFEIDAASGLMQRAVDPVGNTLDFSNSGVTNTSSGIGVSFARNPRGLIAAVTDPAGRRIRYDYDADENLIAVTDRETNTTRFVYSTNRAHYLVQVIDPLGRSGVRVNYDEQGRLTNLVDAATNAVQLVHDLEHSTELVIDAMGRTNSFVYDDFGNVIYETNALGAVTIREYDENFHVTVEVDPLGHTNRFRNDELGNVLERTDPLGNVTRNSYRPVPVSFYALRTGVDFSRRLLASTTDPLGNISQNEYDSVGNLASTTDAQGHVTRYESDQFGNQTSITDAAGNVTQFEYDTRGHLLQQTDAAGNVTRFDYDASGNQTMQVTSVDGRFLTNRTDYSANGRPLAVTDALGNTTRTFYDALGNTAATVDALGHTNRFIYDDRGQLVSTVFADGTSNRIAYDAAGRRTNSTDRAGRSTSFEYDALGRLTRTTYPGSVGILPAQTTSTIYDLAGRVLAQFDERTNRTAFAYDAAGRQTAITNALGFVTRSEFDPAGRKVADIDALGRTTRFIYDELGRRIYTLFADGTTNTTVYDALGRVAVEVDQAGVSNAFGYDALGRLTSVTNAVGTTNQTVTAYAYNEAGNLLRQQDALNRVTRYEYDGLGRRIASVLPLGQRSGTLFNPVGNVAAATNFNGQVIAYEYDANHRLAAKRLPDGTSVEYAYTSTGRRARVAMVNASRSASNVWSFAYDSRDRLIRRIDPDERAIAYAYDASGNRTTLITGTNALPLPEGEGWGEGDPGALLATTNSTTRFTFDALNRLETVIDPDGGTNRYSYDPANNVQFVVLPNGTFRTNAYDALNRVTSIAHLGPTGVFSSFRYTLGPTGQRLGVQENTGRTVQYAYDPLSRLTRESITDVAAGNRTVNYALDNVGNRLARIDSVEGRTDYTYDDNDQLLTETLGGNTTRYTYDFNGNTLSRSNDLEQASYGWSAENRLTNATVNGTNGSHALAYQYDDDGIRVAAFVDGDETRFLIDANRPFAQVVEEYAPNGVVRAAYTHGPHHLISQSRGGARSWYHADGLGSTRALTGQSGSPTDRYHFDAYGRTLAQSGPTDNAYLYAGEQRDRNLGLDYLRARYLATSLGRFVGRDELDGVKATPVTRHQFIYAVGDPVDNLDPSGKFAMYLQEAVALALYPNIIAPYAVQSSVYLNWGRRSGYFPVLDHVRRLALRDFAIKQKPLVASRRISDCGAFVNIIAESARLVNGRDNKARTMIEDLKRVLIGDGFLGFTGRGQGIYFAEGFGSSGFRREFQIGRSYYGFGGTVVDVWDQVGHATAGIVLGYDSRLLSFYALATEADTQDRLLYQTMFPIGRSLDDTNVDSLSSRVEAAACKQ